MMRVNCDTAQEYYLQQTIKDKLLGYSSTHPKCNGSIMLQLAVELRQCKEDFKSSGKGGGNKSSGMGGGGGIIQSIRYVCVAG
jgi:hypothetical protein